MQPPKQLLQRFPFSLDDHTHASIGTILHPSREIERLSPLPCVMPEKDTLNKSMNISL